MAEVHVENVSEGASKRKSRLRFSLRRFFAVVTFVCLAVGWWSAARENTALNEEVLQLRRDVRKLVITDPRKVHAVQKEDLREYTWTWRIYVPEDGAVDLWYQVNEIPGRGRPKRPIKRPAPGLDAPNITFSQGGVERLPSGEYDITFAWRRGTEGEWQFVYRWQSSQTRRRFTQDTDLKWITGPSPSTTGGVDTETAVKEPDEPLVLLRYRIHPTGVMDNKAITPGLIVWLE